MNRHEERSKAFFKQGFNDYNAGRPKRWKSHPFYMREYNSGWALAKGEEPKVSLWAKFKAFISGFSLG